MMIGLLGKEPGVAPQDSARFGVRIVEPILDVMGIPHTCIETNEDVTRISQVINDAWSQSRPAAILIGARPDAAARSYPELRHDLQTLISAQQRSRTAAD
jgi:hypothetical protein